jgi:Carbohydrate binding domain
MVVKSPPAPVSGGSSTPSVSRPLPAQAVTDDEADDVEHKIEAATNQLPGPQQKQIRQARRIVGAQAAVVHQLPPTGPVQELREWPATRRFGGFHAIRAGPAIQKAARDAAQTRALCAATHNAPAGDGGRVLEALDDRITVCDDNLALNPGFENGSTSWTLNRGGPVVSTGTHVGAGAMELVGQSVYTSASQEIPIIPGASIKVSGWLKTDSIPVDPRAKMQLLWLDSTHTPTGTAFYPANNIGGTTGWTYYPTTPTLYTAPSNAVYARLDLRLDGASTDGHAYFDDVRLMIIDNKMINGFMEHGTTGWTLQGGSVPTITTTAANVRSASQAMQILGDTTNYGQALQKITGLAPATVYNVSGWIKTNAVPGGSPARIYLNWRNSAGTAIGSSIVVGNTAVTGTQNYGKVSSTLTSPANTASADIFLKLDAGATNGTAWFDDIYFK